MSSTAPSESTETATRARVVSALERGAPLEIVRSILLETRIGAETNGVLVQIPEPIRAALEYGWNQAIASLRYADGSAVEVVSVSNPYALESKP